MNGSTREALPQTLGVPINTSHPLLRLAAVAIVTALALAVPAAGALAADDPPADRDPASPALATPFLLVEGRDVDDRLPQPEDRYALAGGCYTIEVPGAGFVTRDDDGLGLSADGAAAEPFHFQATRLGQYLIATNEAPEDRWEDAWWSVRGYLSASSLLPVGPLGPVPLLPDVALTGDGVTVASEPSDAADWEITAAGDDTFVVSLPSAGQAMTVDDGSLALTDGEPGAFAFHHVASGEGCAVWPEIDTNTSGAPTPASDNPADEVDGFFEAHVHGMAFEFLGGELRCGRPWHPYGVEYALGNCYDDGNFLNSMLEVVVAGRGPDEPFTSYDPIGWPTFSYWPAYDTLTHEQFYWKWVERAYHGGLRLVTNLLVDNTALCQVFPHKRNSCNEMDGVRLQAQRIFELQDYIDAQSGGPGRGWLRIVTSPSQAREVINAGRMAVVLGIEVSELFDCREVLDVPLCSTDEIDERLQEVFDMGVRQMELVNKFDNALSGVTGDGGTTGVIVNTGNRWVTGHWWDMETCADEHDHSHEHGFDGHEHDKTQMNPRDDIPGGDSDEIDVLAGAVLDTFGLTSGYVAPVYPRGPHCNARGLTELGAHLVREMIAKGMIFDPDHMSASAMREALDLIEHEIIPAEHAAAAHEPRAPVQPAVISSHSWANDVVYQRIYQLDGVVAPRTASADSFVNRWAQNKDWAAELTSPGYVFGLGYGADTNGLGAQPGRRNNPVEPIEYTDEGFPAPIGDVTIYQQTSGLKAYDINTDGVAHYGLFADWFRELALSADERAADRGGADALIGDMLRGAEAYIQMWERAVYGGNDCVDDQSTLQHEDLHALLGLNVEGFLTAAGAPLSRDGAAYIYCVEGEGGYDVVEVRFDADGRASELAPASLAGVLTANQLHSVRHHHGHDQPEHAPNHAVLLLGLAGLSLPLRARLRRR